MARNEKQVFVRVSEASRRDARNFRSLGGNTNPNTRIDKFYAKFGEDYLSTNNSLKAYRSKI